MRTTRSRTVRSKPQSEQQPVLECDDAGPADIDEFRNQMVRDISTFLGFHRKCGEKICRRLKRCAGPDFRCSRDFPNPPMTREEENARIAEVFKALEASIAEREKLPPMRGKR